MPSKIVIGSSKYRSAYRSASGKVVLVLICIGALLAVLLVVGFLPKLGDKRALNEKEDERNAAVRTVDTFVVKPAALSESVKLPCNLGAMQFATIYSRVDGYLKGRLVDIGDNVKRGQLLAEIDTPTIDEEISKADADLSEARAQLAAAQADLKGAKVAVETTDADIKKAQTDQSYAQVTADRWKHMSEEGAVSLQSRDERSRSLGAQNANVEAAVSRRKGALEQVRATSARVALAQAGIMAREATVRKFKAQQDFKYVRAPFDGVIVSRKVDPGALISAGSQTQTQELFQLAKLDVLRSYINVPQSISNYLRPGQTAEITLTSFPGRKFPGKLTNVAGALDPQTRTRQTEVQIENYDHELLPGMYAQLTLSANRADDWVQIPSSAIIPKDNGMAVVQLKDGKAHFQEVVLGRDFGDTIEIKHGLAVNETVIVSPPDDLREGDAVQASEPAVKEAAQAPEQASK